jgi:hypothetical protein
MIAPLLAWRPAGGLSYQRKEYTPMEEKILSAVSTVGFPIVITFYLLIRFQTTMDKFCDKLDALILEIRKEHS